MQQLDNLVKINKLRKEAPDQAELDGMVQEAEAWLGDAQNESNSTIGRFVLAYDAAHALSLAAMRWHGYRASERYILFQSLEHTLGLEKNKCRVLSLCHDRRNNAHYEGRSQIDDQLLAELIQVTREVLELVRQLGPVKEG